MNVSKRARVLLLGLSAVFLHTARTEGVLFLSTSDPSFNTTAPTGGLADSGWQYEGLWGHYLGTAIAPNLFLAAKHVGGSVGDIFSLNGVAHHTVAFFDQPDTDLRIWEVAETFPTYAPLYSNTDEVGKPFVVFGRGTDRGAAVALNGTARGWQWGGTNDVERWGENTVVGTAFSSVAGPELYAHFSQKGGLNQCGLSAHDSSGGWFIQDGAAWKLAGVSYSVEGPFSFDGTTNTQFDATLFDARGLYYLRTTNAWAQISPRYPLPFPTSFYGSRVSSSISWIDSVMGQQGKPLQITAGPSVANPLATIGNTAVVKLGDMYAFSVTTYNTLGNPVSCAWDFGDNSGSASCGPSHAFTACGAYPVSVTLSDSVNSVTTGLTVAVACPLEITSLKLQMRFTRTGADNCTLKGTLPGPPADFGLTNAVVTLSVGNASTAFELDARGKGRGANAVGNIKLAYNRRSGVWTFTVKLKGSLRDAWSRYGLTAGNTGSSEVMVPVVLLLESATTQSFALEPVLSFSNRSGISGVAVY